MNFHKFTVKGQLTFAFSLLTALLLVVSITAISALGTANTHFNEVNRVSLLVANVVEAVDRHAIGARNAVLVSTPDILRWRSKPF